MKGRPDTAMVLAAGLGKRMRPITDSMPKPMVPVCGRALIDRILDQLSAHGVSRKVINLHYLADMLEDHLKRRPDADSFLLSDERSLLLETGGGIRNALPLLGADPIYALNADTLWLDHDGDKKALDRLAEQFDPDQMDCLLLLVPKERAIGFDGAGDFYLDQNSATIGSLGEALPIRFRGAAKSAPYVFTGIQIVKTALYRPKPLAPFSNLEIFKDCADRGTLFGLVHKGDWLHVGSAENLGAAENFLKARGLD